ncbi:MAG TPA: hypothetical protein VMS01_04115 [Stellaceae bacterium]|nr:hypothetical protein [Stellaceae bacterium]
MRLTTPFDPIEPGETDNFAFDFTADMGAATLAGTTWTCALAPYQTASDPAAGSRIIATSTATTIAVRDPLTGNLAVKTGFFSVALVGGMPTSAIGATYVLSATVTTSDGRTLVLSSTVLCSPNSASPG